MNRSILNPRFVVLTGLLIRLLVIPFTLNWDLWANTRLADTFDLKQLDKFYEEPIAAYPPPTYIWLKSSLNIIKLINGNAFNLWISDSDFGSITNPLLYRYLALIKLPYLIVEIACAFLFSSLFKARQKLFAYMLWWWNPAVIFLVSAWTNIDVFVILFVLLSIKAFQSKRLMLSAAFMSTGVTFKILPVFFLPFLILAIPRISRKIVATLVCVAFVIAGHIPVLPVLASYVNHAIIGGYRDQVLFSILAIGPDRTIIVVYLLYFLLLFLFLYIKETERQSRLVSYIFGVLVIIFSFSRFSLQWFIWLVPFLNIIIIKFWKLRWYPVMAYGVFFLMIFFSQASLNIGMLNPLEATLWRLDYPWKQILGEKNLVTLFNTLHTVFSAGLIFAGINILKEEMI